MFNAKIGMRSEKPFPDIRHTDIVNPVRSFLFDSYGQPYFMADVLQGELVKIAVQLIRQVQQLKATPDQKTTDPMTAADTVLLSVCDKFRIEHIRIQQEFESYTGTDMLNIPKIQLYGEWNVQKVCAVYQENMPSFCQHIFANTSVGGPNAEMDIKSYVLFKAMRPLMGIYISDQVIREYSKKLCAWSISREIGPTCCAKIAYVR